MAVTISDGESAIEIAMREIAAYTDGRPADIRVAARVSTRGFEGTNESVWFLRADYDRFIEDLRVLERVRRGEARLCSMSPDEFMLHIYIRDRAGHLSSAGFVGQSSFQPDGVRVDARIGFHIDIDPTLLPHLCGEFASLIRTS
jgi:hypothetical protein